MDRLSSASPAVGGILAVPLHLIDGFYAHASSQTVDDPGIAWAWSAKKNPAHSWLRTIGTLLTNKRMISILHILTEASFYGKLSPSSAA